MRTSDQEKEPSKPSSRLEAELAEILQRADRPPSNVIKFRSHVRQNRWKLRNALRVPEINPGMLLLGSLVFAMAGAVLRSQSAFVASILGILSLACLIGVYVMGFRHPGGPRGVKKWRGRGIDFDEPSRPAWMNRGPRFPKR